MSANRVALALLAALLAACSRGPSATPSPDPAAAAADPARPLPSPLPDVVARVNGQPIRLQQILPLARAEFGALPAEAREGGKPAALRSALRKYVDRELLLQEAVARGVQADAREVEWAYDQMRRDHRDEKAWAEYLAREGMDPQSLRTELRGRYTVEALLAQERALRPDDPEGALLERLRAKARVELLL